ncbi:MAG: hypothetical protein QHI48_02960 [Bacteroidota bacterium]|nr:hypothetical protein [Bacteroidota bacterium]
MKSKGFPSETLGRWNPLRKTAIVLSLAAVLVQSPCNGTRDSTKSSAAGPAIVGIMSWREWVAATGWDIRNEVHHFPEEKLRHLRSLVERNNASFIVFASSRCEECHEHLPRIFSMFEEAGIDTSRVTLVGVDESLREPTGAFARFEIPSTPCVVVLRGETVAGMIAYPDFRWLNGMLRILESE